jgi:hypothetical protein
MLTPVPQADARGPVLDRVGSLAGELHQYLGWLLAEPGTLSRSGSGLTHPTTRHAQPGNVAGTHPEASLTNRANADDERHQKRPVVPPVAGARQDVEHLLVQRGDDDGRVRPATWRESAPVPDLRVPLATAEP